MLSSQIKKPLQENNKTHRAPRLHTYCTKFYLVGSLRKESPKISVMPSNESVQSTNDLFELGHKINYESGVRRLGN